MPHFCQGRCILATYGNHLLIHENLPESALPTYERATNFPSGAFFPPPLRFAKALIQWVWRRVECVEGVGYPDGKFSQNVQIGTDSETSILAWRGERFRRRNQPEGSQRGIMMLKKVMCLMAALVLVSACDSDSSGSGDGLNGGGAGGNGKMGAARPGTQEDLVVNVGDRIFFDYNEQDLKPEARATLDRQAAWLKKYPQVNVTVEGHCDERGTREYNLALGERRATAVKNYLVADGVNAGRVKTVSYGKERPAVVGSNEAAWAQNRRGVTVVTQ